MFLGASLPQGTGQRQSPHPQDCLPAVISGLDANRGQAGDSHVHGQERTSGDQKPRHPCFPTGKARCWGPVGDVCVCPVTCNLGWTSKGRGGAAAGSLGWLCRLLKGEGTQASISPASAVELHHTALTS